MKYKRDSVLIYESFWIAMCDLAAETQARLLKAIMEYGMYGKEPDLVGIEKSFFTLIRPQIDANNTRYWNRRGGKEPVETSQTGSYAQKSAQGMPSTAEVSDCATTPQQTTSSAQPQTQKCNYTPEYVEESGTFAIVNVQNGEACEGNATANAANAQGENCAQKPVANGQNTPKYAYGVGISREGACAEGRARSRVETDDKAECRQFADAKRESLQEFPSEYVPEYIEEKEFVATEAPQPQVNKREQVCFPSDYVPEYVEEKEFEITQVYQEPNADSEPLAPTYIQPWELNVTTPQKQNAQPREANAHNREPRSSYASREPCANMREPLAQTHTQPWEQEAEYAEPATCDCTTPRTRAAPKPRTKRFVPPTPQEVAEFCRANDINVDAERFCCFYQSKGWQVGSSPMRDWQAAARGWARSQRAAETIPKAIIGKPLDRRPYTDEELNALYTPLEE